MTHSFLSNSTLDCVRPVRSDVVPVLHVDRKLAQEIFGPVERLLCVAFLNDDTEVLLRRACLVASGLHAQDIRSSWRRRTIAVRAHSVLCLLHRCMMCS